MFHRDRCFGARTLVFTGCCLNLRIGAGAGGLIGALVGLGIPEYEAKRYEAKLKEGNILISVHSDNRDETKRAKEIFERGGADEVSSSSEEKVRTE